MTAQNPHPTVRFLTSLPSDWSAVWAGLCLSTLGYGDRSLLCQCRQCVSQERTSLYCIALVDGEAIRHVLEKFGGVDAFLD